MSWDKDAGFAKAKAWVFRTLKLYLMIDQYAQKQLFVRQGLDAFLAVLGLQQRPKGA